MSEINISMEGGTSKRLLTAGKYCDRDIVVTASGADTTVEDGLVKRSLAGEYTNERIGSVGQHAFRGCTKITAFHIPNAESLGSYAFYQCTGVSAFSFPKANSVGSYTFSAIEATTVDLPVCTSLSSYAFSGADKLVDINVPKLTTLSASNTFRQCTSLAFVDMAFCTNLKATTFSGCTILTDVVLRRESAICSLAATSAFTGTPFATGGTGGRVYVPSALIATYQAATNWTAPVEAGTCTFLPLEEYTVDGTTTGAFDKTKI